MKAITKFAAAGAAIAAVAGAAPAAAQVFPGYGNPYGYGYNNSPYGGQYGYGANCQVVASQCAAAVQGRLNGGYNGYGAYGGGYGYNGYAYNGGGYGYGGGRVLGISRIEPRGDGGFSVRGVATNGYAVNGYAPNSPNLVWHCRTDFRGAIVDIDVDPAQRNYRYDYTPYNNDYSQYGYQRY